MAKNHYVDAKELREHWQNWVDTNNEESWEQLNNFLMLICRGVATKFSPSNEDELQELASHAFTKTLIKIVNGKNNIRPKLIDNGLTSPFNLLTTAIHRTLCTHMKRKDRQRHHYSKYRERIIHNNEHIVT